MADIRGIVTDPLFGQLSTEQKRELLLRAEAPPAFVNELLGSTPDDGVVNDQPGGGWDQAAAEGSMEPGSFFGRNAPHDPRAVLGTGIVRGLANTGLGAAELAAKGLAHLPGDPADPTSLSGMSAEAAAKLEKARLKFGSGRTPFESKVRGAEQIAEAFVPGLGGKRAVTALGAALRGAGEMGLVGSLQAGAPNPEAAAGGALGGLTGKGIQNFVSSLVKRFGDSAPKVFAHILSPAGDQAKRSARTGIKEMLADEPIVGDLPELVQQAGARVGRLAQPVEAYHATNTATNRTVDLRPLRKRMFDLAKKAFSPDRQDLVSPQKLEAVNATLRKLHAWEDTYGSLDQVPISTAESWLKEVSELYDKSAAGSAAGSADKLRRVFSAEPMRRALDAGVPERRALMQPLSHAKSLEKALTSSELADFYRKDSSIGLAGAAKSVASMATRGGMAGAAGMLAGGTVGMPAEVGGAAAVAGMASSVMVPKIIAVLRSPRFISKSAYWRATVAKELPGLLAKMPELTPDQLLSIAGSRVGDNLGESQ